ncbi:hypothetical protein F5Y13DRAFT_203960 [Hypoxylon sp. FL1857]|nr:hypothetical protein F5Y13DRAFT_203960 [Hypoxylon sp. FL1857]
MPSEHQQQPCQVRRELVKGRLRPPSKPASTKSYTVSPALSNEVMVRQPAERQAIQAPVEISSAATAQPFVDPTVLDQHRRTNGLP